MGHTKLEIDVYSCAACGWVGTQLRMVKVEELAHDEMGQVRNGSRGGQLRYRFDCPNCRIPIKPSSPVNLIEVKTVETRKKRKTEDETTLPLEFSPGDPEETAEDPTDGWGEEREPGQ